MEKLRPRLVGDTVCMHQSVKLVWVPVGGNSRQLRHQCQDCGGLHGKAMPHHLATPNTSLVDAAMIERWETQHRPRWERFQKERREKYQNYLASEQWWKRRAMVLRRANDICEGCGLRAATQVHHLTYQHIFSEFLFELVAVCDECHLRLHDYRWSIETGSDDDDL
jgi:hypothetical protein